MTAEKQGVTNIKRISIRKDEEQIQTNTYILTFNQPHSRKVVKIGYNLERVEKYIPWFRCQKYGHQRKGCRERLTYAKCGKKDPDHIKKNCLKEIRCPTCRQDHPTYSRSCYMCKKMLEVKHKRNVSLQETVKIVQFNMKGTPTPLLRWEQIQFIKYWALVEKLIQLEPKASKVSGASEKTTLDRISTSTNSITPS